MENGSSFGDPSTSAKPTGKETPKRKGDQEGELDAHKPKNSPKTKVAMLNAMVTKFNGMKKDKLQASYEKMMDDEDYDDMEEPKKKMKESVEEIFEGQEGLTEDFKERATTIFEAAVAEKVSEIIEQMEIDLEEQLEEEKKEIESELADKIDGYLSYAVSEWLEENELAIETGIRSELSESFLSGLKTLFDEHYVDIPESKVEITEELANAVEVLEEKLNKESARGAALYQQSRELERQLSFHEISEGLTALEKEKFFKLSENVEFNDQDQFFNELTVIREHYFDSGEEDFDKKSFAVADEQVPLEEEIDSKNRQDVPVEMRRYVEAISKTIRK